MLEKDLTLGTYLVHFSLGPSHFWTLGGSNSEGGGLFAKMCIVLQTHNICLKIIFLFFTGWAPIFLKHNSCEKICKIYLFRPLWIISPANSMLLQHLQMWFLLCYSDMFLYKNERNYLLLLYIFFSKMFSPYPKKNFIQKRLSSMFCKRNCFFLSKQYLGTQKEN